MVYVHIRFEDDFIFVAPIRHLLILLPYAAALAGSIRRVGTILINVIKSCVELMWYLVFE